MSKKQRAIIFMLTANYAFALASMLVNLRKTNAGNYDDVVVYHDGLTEKTCQQLQSIEPNLKFIRYTLNDWQEEHIVRTGGGKQQAFLQRFSHFSLSKYKLFEQLAHYRQVLFLDLDMVVYGDLSPIFSVAGMAWRTEAMFVNKFGSMTGKPSYEGLGDVPKNHPAPNGGLIYADDSISWQECLDEARRFINTFSDSFASVLDELTFSWVAYWFELPVTELDHRVYNTLPKVVDEHTRIAHFMGAEKTWNNELMQLAHPIWLQNYAEALSYGDFDSEKVIRHNAHGQILRKYINQNRWLKLLDGVRLQEMLPPHLKLSLNLEGESLAVVYSDDVIYYLTLNRNMDVYRISFEIKNKLLIQDSRLRHSMSELAKQNNQLDYQKFTHKLIISTNFSYPPEQLGGAWQYFYRTTWVCVESYL